jgi:hypothetical protein
MFRIPAKVYFFSSGMHNMNFKKTNLLFLIVVLFSNIYSHNFHDKHFTIRPDSTEVGHNPQRKFMNQARMELDCNFRPGQHNTKKLILRNFLRNQQLNVARYIHISKIPPEQTYSFMTKLSKSMVTEIKGSMEALKSKFCHNKKFRKKAKQFYKIEHFKTKQRFFVHGKNYYAIEKLADHVIECAELVIREKYLQESNLAHKIKTFYEFLGDTIIAKSAMLAGSRLISFVTLFIKNILQDPLATGKNLLFGMGHQILQVFKFLEWETKIANPMQHFSEQRKKNESLVAYRQRALQNVAKEICTTTNGLMGKINSFISLMETNPRQATIEIFATAMEFALLDILLKGGVANYQVSKFVKPAVDSMRSGLSKISSNISLINALQNMRCGLYPPIKGLGAEPALVSLAELGDIGSFLAESTQKETIKRGAIIQTLEVIEKNPNIIVGKQTLSEVFKEIVHLSPTKRKTYIAKSDLLSHYGFEKTINAIELINKNKPWTMERFRHVSLGDLSATNGYKLYGGLHTWEGFERFLEYSGMDISKFIIKDLGNGVTGVHFPKNAFVRPKFYNNATANNIMGKPMQGVKTFWPKNFTHADIINAANELFLNVENITKIRKNGSKTFKKRLDSGLKIEGTIKPTGKIGSVYPSWVQQKKG